jgi:hypothetical protein
MRANDRIELRDGEENAAEALSHFDDGMIAATYEGRRPITGP